MSWYSFPCPSSVAFSPFILFKSASRAWIVAALASRRAFNSVNSPGFVAGNTAELTSSRCFSCSNSLIFFSLLCSFPSSFEMWLLRISMHSLSLRRRSSSNSNFNWRVFISSSSLALSFSMAASCRLKRRINSSCQTSLPLDASLSSVKLMSVFFTPLIISLNSFETEQSSTWFGDLISDGQPTCFRTTGLHSIKYAEESDELSTIFSSSMLLGRASENPL